MVDGEFSGPDWVRNPTMAWALLAFQLPVVGPELPTVEQLELDSITVRMAVREDQYDPDTLKWWRSFPDAWAWATDAACIEPRAKAMRRVSEWCRKQEACYGRAVFVAKPASIDVGRLTSDLHRAWGTELAENKEGGERGEEEDERKAGDRTSPFIPWFRSVCLSTRIDMVGRVMRMKWHVLNHHFSQWKKAMGCGGRVLHLPLSDCRQQLAVFVATEFMMATGSTQPPRGAGVKTTAPHAVRRMRI